MLMPFRGRWVLSGPEIAKPARGRFSSYSQAGFMYAE